MSGALKFLSDDSLSVLVSDDRLSLLPAVVSRLLL